jgi:hypothetical protein
MDICVPEWMYAHGVWISVSAKRLYALKKQRCASGIHHHVQQHLLPVVLMKVCRRDAGRTRVATNHFSRDLVWERD